MHPQTKTRPSQFCVLISELRLSRCFELKCKYTQKKSCSHEKKNRGKWRKVWPRKKTKTARAASGRFGRGYLASYSPTGEFQASFDCFVARVDNWENTTASNIINHPLTMLTQTGSARPKFSRPLLPTFRLARLTLICSNGHRLPSSWDQSAHKHLVGLRSVYTLFMICYTGFT